MTFFLKKKIMYGEFGLCGSRAMCKIGKFVAITIFIQIIIVD
jgi:hypothetical protein